MLKLFTFGLFLALGSFKAFSLQAKDFANDYAVGKEITISEVIKFAITTNPDLQSLARNVDIASENIDLAESNYRPSINISGDIVHIQSDNDLTNEWQGATGKSISLNIEQSIFRGGQTTADIKEQKILKTVSEDNLNSFQQSIIVEVVEAYMATYRATQALRVNEDNVSLLTEQKKATDARFDAGELTLTDVSQAEARLADSQASLIQTKAFLEVALASLRQVSGISNIPELAYPNIKEEYLPDTVEEAITLGLTHNPEISAAESEVMALNYNINEQRGAFLPQVSAGAGVGYDHNPVFGQFSSQESATISLNATMPIYQKGVLKNQLRQAKILKYKAEVNLTSIKRSVTYNIISAWEEFMATTAQIAAREAQLKSSKIAFEGVKLEEELGARSVLELLDANQDIRNAELALIDAQRDKVNTYYRLIGSIGLLSESLWDNS